jgi:bisphosphoglycerate-dependent phosphoglycerate mutase
MRLYLVRHGESEANVLGVFSNRGFKHPLTAHGREQAVGLAGLLAGKGISRIYTSPLQRAGVDGGDFGNNLGRYLHNDRRPPRVGRRDI